MTVVDHFEALFDKTYLRWFHLQGKPALVKIKSVKRNVPMVLPGGAKTKKPVIELELVNGAIEAIKPLVLNNTNAHAIALIHGDRPSQWPGCEIVLQQDKTTMFSKEQGQMIEVNCIRIRAKKGEKDVDSRKA